MRLATWALAVAALSSACKLSSEDPEDFQQDTDFDSGLDLGDEPEDRAYAMKLVASVLVTNPSPISNDVAVSSVTSWLLVAWHRDGTEVSWDETVCDLASNEVFGTQTTYPTAFRDSIPVRTRTGSLSGTSTGATLTVGPYIDLMGVDLDDPASDPLPTAADDPTVTDDDGDGQPGVTVHIIQSMLGEADVYVAQRATTTLTGTVVGLDRIEGVVDMTSEQVVLDASAWWAKLDTQAEVDPDPAHNFFILQGVDEGTSCAEVLENRDALF